MIDDHSNDLLHFKKAQKRKHLEELGSMREELLQQQLQSHYLIDMLKQNHWPQEVCGEDGFFAFSYRFRARNIALLDRLDRYIESVETEASG